MRVVQNTNLHSFIDRGKAVTNNARLRELISPPAMQKHKFALYFIFSILKQRGRVEKVLSASYKPGSSDSTASYVSDLDIAFLVDDLLSFLQQYPSNPFIFMNHYFAHLFHEREPYNS